MRCLPFLLALLLLFGCSNKNAAPFEKAAAELPAAQAEAKAAGLSYDPATYSPPAVDETQDARPLYQKAWAAWKAIPQGLRDEDTKRWSEVTAGKGTDRAAYALTKHKDLLNLVLAASRKPHCSYRLVSDDTQKPDYSAMKAFAQALGAAAVLSASKGDFGACKAQLVAIQGIAGQVAEQPDMLSQLVAIAVSKIGLHAGSRAVTIADAKRGAVDAAEAAAQAVPDITFQNVIQGELLTTVDYIRKLQGSKQLREDAAKIDAIGGMESGMTAMADKLDKATEGVPQDVVHKALEARTIQIWVEAAKKGKGKSNLEFGQLLEDLGLQAEKADATHILNAGAGPNVATGHAIQSLTEKKHAALAGLAILRQGSKFPANASGLSGDGAKLVRDYGLTYERTPSGFTVWSESYAAIAQSPAVKKGSYDFVYPLP